MDSSGVLIPATQTLIVPPDERSTVYKRQKKYKRPGKEYNRPKRISCDACRKGGVLVICCYCLASFHRSCCDPPLNDIQPSLWLCRKCHGSNENKKCYALSSRGASSTNKSHTEKKSRTINTNKHSRFPESVAMEEPEPKKKLSRLDLLVNAARILNPKLFEMPQENNIPYIIPGTPYEGSNNHNARVDELDHTYCVPVRAKSCHGCGKTSENETLIHCDYCPLSYHENCLNPSLSKPPLTRWMCPNHSKHFIDMKLVNSISLMKEVTLWDKHTVPNDQQAINIDILRQTRLDISRFQPKAPTSVVMIVPDGVDVHFKNLPPVLPRRPELVTSENLLMNQTHSDVLFQPEETDSTNQKTHLDRTTEQRAQHKKPLYSVTVIADSDFGSLSDCEQVHMSPVKRRRQTHLAPATTPITPHANALPASACVPPLPSSPELVPESVFDRIIYASSPKTRRTAWQPAPPSLAREGVRRPRPRLAVSSRIRSMRGRGLPRAGRNRPLLASTVTTASSQWTSTPVLLQTAAPGRKLR